MFVGFSYREEDRQSAVQLRQDARGKNFHCRIIDYIVTLCCKSLKYGAINYTVIYVYSFRTNVIFRLRMHNCDHNKENYPK